MDNQNDLENGKLPNLNVEDEENEAQEEAFKEEFIKDLSSFVEGQLVGGTVVDVTTDSVFIDIGYKSEGEISIYEFNEKPEVGDSLNVMIVKKESRDGRLILSKQRADEIIHWDAIKNSYKEGNPVEGIISETIKGGFSVDVGNVKAFLPTSQLSIRRVDKPQNYFGKVLLFKVAKMNGKNNVVLSHKKYLEEINEQKIEEFFKTKKEGDIVEGVIKDIVNYGAFVNLGSIDGLLHVNDMSWGKVSDPNRYIKKGEKLNLKILTMDSSNRKVSLGIKQLIPDPWESFENRYEKGKKYKGTVIKLTNFGAFIELEDGVEGLLHVSELSWTKRINHPKEVVKTGDMVEVMILDFDLKKKTISLGLKQVLPNPWDNIESRLSIGSRIKAAVTKITRFGAYIELEEGIEGFLHVNEISWTKQIKNCSDAFKKDDLIDVVILSIDKEAKRIQIGLKQLTDNPWVNLKMKYPKGSVVTGFVTSITDFGVFVKVDEDIEGLIHISQLANEKIEDPKEHFKVGDKVKATVINIDEDKKKVALSIKEFINRLEENEMKKYLEDDSKKTGSVTLGDLIDLKKIGK
jgi:small subunit ribosomal protein S1